LEPMPGCIASGLFCMRGLDGNRLWHVRRLRAVPEEVPRAQVFRTCRPLRRDGDRKSVV